MLVTIGILARNEADSIGATVESLFRQSVFLSPGALAIPDVQWQVIVVANGCTDDTADRARDALKLACEKLPSEAIGWLVESLERGGKSNAWNELIHRISPSDTCVFVMIDADIEFGHPDTIANSIARLEADPSALVVVDLALKDFTRKKKLNLLERISVMQSSAREGHPPGIAGSFYCARSSTLRNIWLPIGLSVEDGFLATMVTSDFFRGSPDPSRIVRAENATHYFEGISDIRQVVMHEVRLVIGTLLNCYLCWDALLFLTPADGKGAGPIIRDLNASKPDWYPRMMANQIAVRGIWIIPTAMLFRRWTAWWRLPLLKKIIRLPVTIATFAFDLIVMIIANWRMVTGRAVGFW